MLIIFTSPGADAAYFVTRLLRSYVVYNSRVYSGCTQRERVRLEQLIIRSSLRGRKCNAACADTTGLRIAKQIAINRCAELFSRSGDKSGICFAQRYTVTINPAVQLSVRNVRSVRKTNVGQLAEYSNLRRDWAEHC